MKPYDKTVQTSNVFNVDWLVGTVCNYKCSYCNPELHDGKHKFVSIENANRFFEKLVNQYPDKRFVFILSGGEPTLWKGLPEFIKNVKDRGSEIQIVTNGSRSVEWWEENAPNMDLIVISFHWEHASPDHIEEVCKRLREKHKSHIKVNILVTLEEFEKSYELADRLETNVPGIIIELRPLRKNHGIHMIDYSEEQLERLRTKNRFGRFIEDFQYQEVYTDQNELIRANDLILNKENCWKGWLCHVGVENLKVAYDGRITRANCDVGGFIGNINEKDFELPSEPIICTWDYCKCPTDIRATKERVK